MNARRPTVVLLGQRLDPTLDRVIRGLHEIGTETFRFDLADFPSALEVSVAIHDDDNGDLDGTFAIDSRVVAVRDVASVFYWKPRPLGFERDHPALRFVEAEARAGLGGILRALHVPWVNDPDASTRLSHKVLQLRLARQLGFRIPETLITNSPDEARLFLKRHDRNGVIYKTVSVPMHAVGDDDYVSIFTSAVPSDSFEQLGLVRNTLCMFQERVARSADIRVTVVGDSVFACALTSGSASTDSFVDIRELYGQLCYEPSALPPSVEERLRTMLRDNGLLYGAFDLLLTPDGEYVFLELNPSGLFSWIEYETKQPITAALCAILADPPLRSRSRWEVTARA